MKMTIKDATRLAEVIGNIVEHDAGNTTARAIVQAISWLLPDTVNASAFRFTAYGNRLDLTRRNYVAEVTGK